MEESTKMGRVTSVFNRDDGDKITVNVVTGPNREPREARFSTLHTGFWTVPKEGDIVEVVKRQNETVARFPLDPPENFNIPPDLSEGDVCLKLNQDTKLRFSIQDDGTVDINLAADGDISVTSTAGTVDMDADGNMSVESMNGSVDVLSNNGSVNVNAPSGTVTIDGGEVKIGTNGEVKIDGINFDEHVHDYDDDGTTETTGTPY